MTTALGIAAVTGVLQSVIEEQIKDADLQARLGIAETEVTALPPSVAVDGEGNRLNLFMYRTGVNTGWRNVQLPERNSAGDRVANPPLPLDLHYMLTSVGDADFVTDILLGEGMQVLQDHEQLNRDLIRTTLTDPSLGSSRRQMFKEFLDSGLADQIEAIKLSPYFPDDDELSKIWSSIQTDFRPSAFYEASVVLLRPERPAPKPLPVETPRIFVEPASRPTIESVGVKGAPREPITPGATVVIEGSSLADDHVTVSLGDRDLSPSAPLHNDRIEVTIPSDVTAGPHGLQVFHGIEFAPGDVRPTVASNAAPIMIHPVVTAGSLRGTTSKVRLELQPAVRPGQNVVVLLNPESSDERSVAFAVPEPEYELSVVHGSGSGLNSGEKYRVRVQVDGAASPLAFDASDPMLEPNDTLLIADTLTATDAGSGNVDAEATVEDAGGSAASGVDVEVGIFDSDGSRLQTKTGTTGGSGKVTVQFSPGAGSYRVRILSMDDGTSAFWNRFEGESDTEVTVS